MEVNKDGHGEAKTRDSSQWGKKEEENDSRDK
jgi:hypothetical protein